MKAKDHPMTNILRALTAAAIVAAAAPAAGQTLLLDLNTTVPLAGTLDNPCTTTQVEAIAFTGSTNLSQRVWLLPNGNMRLQFAETTALEGLDAAAVVPLGGTPAKYTVSAAGAQDLEFAPLALDVLQFKKVARVGTDDNFHSVLVLSFDPQNLKLELKLEGACDNGMP
jgi:hypothetical protein